MASSSGSASQNDPAYKPSVYLSSTYEDLIDYRKAVAQTLRKMNKIVTSMEDYTSSDDRPLDKCLEDIAKCDIYVGLFGFRYGFIPDYDNPEQLSITELEWKKARDLGKPCLTFLAEPKGWPMTSSDFYTGEADGGAKIKDMRARVGNRHTQSFFRTPEDLAASVSTAVSNTVDTTFLRGAQSSAEKAPMAVAPLPREISADLLLTYSDVDAEFAVRLANYLISRRLRPLLGQGLLFPADADQFQRLENAVRSCHAAAVLVSDPSLRQMEEKRDLAGRVFDMLQARTENLFALCLSNESANKIVQWPQAAAEPATGWRPEEEAPSGSLNNRLEKLRLNTGLDSGKQWVGLPVIAVAMTAEEAKEIDEHSELVQRQLGQTVYDAFLALRRSMAAASYPILSRYGSRRLDCRPFDKADITIAMLLQAIVARLNEDQPSQLRGRLIKLQNYSFDELIGHRDDMSPIFTQLASTGCVVMVDEYSLYHPEIREALISSGLLSNDQVSLVTLSPTNPYSREPFDLLENELRRRLTAAFDRFASAFDPQCELSVGDEMRLKRWLNASLPHTVQSLRNPKPNRQMISRFAREEGIDAQPRIRPLIYEGEQR